MKKVVDDEDWEELITKLKDSDLIIASLKRVIENLIKDYERYCSEDGKVSPAYKTAKGII